MAFLWGGSSATAWNGIVGSMTGSPMAHITAPPAAELVVQSLLKRQSSPEGTCGFSGTDLYSCGVNEYCYFQTGSDQNLLGCCGYDPGSLQTTQNCSISQTVCIGSTQSVSQFGSGGSCPESTTCCTDPNYPDCLTAVLDNDDGLNYTAFFCAYNYPATAFLTPMDDYVKQTTTALSVSVSTAIVTTKQIETVSPTPQHSSTASASNSTSSQAQQQSTESSTERHKGAIAGGVVGGVAALLVVAAGFFIRHRINVKKREAGGGDDSPEMSGRVLDGMTYNSVAVK